MYLKSWTLCFSFMEGVLHIRMEYFLKPYVFEKLDLVFLFHGRSSSHEEEVISQPWVSEKLDLVFSSQTNGLFFTNEWNIIESLKCQKLDLVCSFMEGVLHNKGIIFE